jgi:hypothetical protein
VGDLMNYLPLPPSHEHPFGTLGHTMIVTGIKHVDGQTRITAIGGNEVWNSISLVIELDRDLSKETVFVDPYI